MWCSDRICGLIKYVCSEPNYKFNIGHLKFNMGTTWKESRLSKLFIEPKECIEGGTVGQLVERPPLREKVAGSNTARDLSGWS